MGKGRVAQTRSAANAVPNSNAADATNAVGVSAESLADMGVTINAQTTEIRLGNGAQPIRVTYDESDPTASVGEYWPAGHVEVVNVATARRMVFIRAGGTDSTLSAAQFSA